ncbi:MAG TPA: site-specific DNA-methyltransferase [Chloroflexi bacterium]|nr:site-specific DNA-methyltransferase [Chloroflexota bacterium]
MSDSLAKFQQLLRELFRFDLADLDFGIYRIMNYKRRVIEHWIDEDLPKAIREELQRGALAEQARAQQRLEEARRKVLEALGRDAIDAEGNLAEPFHNTTVGREYLQAREKAAHVQSGTALETGVYNHLYTFFSRYYQDGDFISRRHYSRKERYLVLVNGEPVEEEGRVLYERLPYNGEEVFLYWANHDQYYVKTAEYFTDYTWKAPNGVTVHFKLKVADVEVNNVKGEKRFFLPRLDEMAWDEGIRMLTIPFEYRPLTEQEAIRYGTKRQQDKIIEEVLAAIPGQLEGNTEALAALTAERCQDAKGNPVSYLAHHLRQYTARNTRDFFIHKDLKGFLSRELDFYLKNEVLNLNEMEAAGEDLAEGWFQLMRLIKRVGNHIIDFLAHIEGFQKMLWEKKKFVTETFYCITVGNIPEEFYPEIAANEAQWEEWRALFHIDELPEDLFSGDLGAQEGRIAFLKAHPTLVLDTRHFPPDFVDRLLASYDDLDGMTDGLLVHSENWQALNLLLEKYRERVKTVYIDPPYNTGSDEFLYRDNYQHSCWLSMMYDRLALGREWMREDGVFFVSCDENEQPRGRLCGDAVFGEGNYVTDVIWNARKSVSSDTLISLAHHHTLFWVKRKPAVDANKYAFRLPAEKGKFSNPDNDPRGPWTLDPFDAPDIRPNLTYEIVNPNTGERHLPPPGRHWRLPREEFEHLLAEGRIVFGKTGTGKPMLKRYWSEAKGKGKTPTTLWTDVPTTTDGTKLLQSIFPKEMKAYLDQVKPKPPGLIERIVDLSSMDAQEFVLDYFAGSGTTGHAVINLNREDGGRRRFILVEMGEYFDTVLLPRIKKVTFSPEWKDGKPKRLATQEEAERGPRIVKVVRLESYEDALNNITFDEESGQRALDLFGDEYLLRYMLRWETRKSETLLNVEKLQSPFSYRLHIHRDGETRVQPVDLPETFAYLIGLDVQRRQVFYDDGRRYLVYRGTTREGRRVVVIWREVEGWTEEDYQRDEAFVAAQGLTEGADEVYINGDSHVSGARPLDGVFKARMFANVEV